MVAHSLQLAEDAGQTQGILGIGRWVFQDIVHQYVRSGTVDLVYWTVHLKQAGGQDWTFLLKGLVQGLQHGQYIVNHFSQVQPLHQFRINGWFLEIKHKPGDTFGKITDAFQVSVGLEYGENKAELNRHRVVQGDDVFHIAVDFQLKGVYPTFPEDDLPGQVFVEGEYCLSGSLELVVNQRPHFQGFFF